MRGRSRKQSESREGASAEILQDVTLAESASEPSFGDEPLLPVALEPLRPVDATEAPLATATRDTYRQLSREIAENHALANRTHNSLATLAASLQAMVARHEKLDRRLHLNSFVAYLLFTLLLGGAFYLLYQGRADRLVAERDDANRRQVAATDEATMLRAELAARDAAARKASDFQALLTSGKKEQAIAAYPDIARERLSPVEAQSFQQGVEKARADLVDESYAAGLEAGRAEQWKKASTALERALGFEGEGSRATAMRYHLGIALHKQGSYLEASRQLEQALAGGVERTVGADARFYLANALEMLRQLDRARAEYQRFSDGRWTHPLSATARRKIREISDKLNTAR